MGLCSDSKFLIQRPIVASSTNLFDHGGGARWAVSNLICRRSAQLILICLFFDRNCVNPLAEKFNGDGGVEETSHCVAFLRHRCQVAEAEFCTGTRRLQRGVRTRLALEWMGDDECCLMCPFV